MKTLVWPNPPFDRSAPAEISSFGNSPLSETILSRSPHYRDYPSPSQTEADRLVSGFLSQATDWKSLVAMTVGGLAYRWGRIAVLSPQSIVLGQGYWASHLLRGGSVVFGLASEISTFELTHRTLQTLTKDQGQGTTDLWNWSGPGGWKEGLLSSFVTFGTLQGFGQLSQGQNLIVQHGFQDVGMVLGHQLVSQVGLGTKPEGTLAEQFRHAEVTNIQIGAGMALGHSITGGRVFAVERAMDHLASGFPPPVREGSRPEARDRNGRGLLAPKGLRTSLSRFVRSSRLAAAVPFSPEFLERIRPTDPELKTLMDPIALNDPHFPMLRLALAAGLVTVPLLLRPFSKKASERARLLRDIVVPPLVGISLLVGEGNSLDCYLPEILAGAVTAVSLTRRAIARWRRK